MLPPAARCQPGQSQQAQRCTGWFRNGEADIAGGGVDDAPPLQQGAIAVESEVLRYIGAGSQLQLCPISRCDEQLAHVGEERNVVVGCIVVECNGGVGMQPELMPVHVDRMFQYDGGGSGLTGVMLLRSA